MSKYLPMTFSTRQLLKDWHIVATTPLAFLLCVVQSVIITQTIPLSSKSFVLRQSVYFGAIQIGQWWELFVPILIVAGFVLLNALISFLVYEKNRVLARFLSWFSLLLALLLGASTYIVTTSKLIS